MKRRYLRTVEDFLAYKDTDEKIYNSCSRAVAYFQFVNGYFCRFDKNGEFLFNVGIDVNGQDFYVLEEEKAYEKPVQEATSDDVGTLCWFWDFYEDKKHLGRLESFCKNVSYRYIELNGVFYKHCRRLTPSEVAELTGYKVEEK